MLKYLLNKVLTSCKIACSFLPGMAMLKPQCEAFFMQPTLHFTATTKKKKKLDNHTYTIVYIMLIRVAH